MAAARATAILVTAPTSILKPIVTDLKNGLNNPIAANTIIETRRATAISIIDVVAVVALFTPECVCDPISADSAGNDGAVLATNLTRLILRTSLFISIPIIAFFARNNVHITIPAG